VQEFAQHTTPLSRLYLPVYEAHIQQMRGDLDGALESYRKAIAQLARAGQDTGAREALGAFVGSALLMGESSMALTFARQQKLHGEELPMVSLLEAVRGDQTASERDLQNYVSARPWLSTRYIELQRNGNQAVAALMRSDGRTALGLLAHFPDFQAVDLCFERGRAYQLVNDYSSAEQQFRRALQQARLISGGAAERGQLPLMALLSHFHLGQIYEASGKNQPAIDEYQAFLSHFEGSRAKMPQVAEARGALKRLMH